MEKSKLKSRFVALAIAAVSLALAACGQQYQDVPQHAGAPQQGYQQQQYQGGGEQPQMPVAPAAPVAQAPQQHAEPPSDGIGVGGALMSAAAGAAAGYLISDALSSKGRQDSGMPAHAPANPQGSYIAAPAPQRPVIASAVPPKPPENKISQNPSKPPTYAATINPQGKSAITSGSQKKSSFGSWSASAKPSAPAPRRSFPSSVRVGRR